MRDAMTDQEIIEVVTAHVAGQSIQTTNRDSTTMPWSPCTNPKWDFERCLYRAKPLAKEGEVVAVRQHVDHRWCFRKFHSVANGLFKCYIPNCTGANTWEYARPLTAREKGNE